MGRPRQRARLAQWATWACVGVYLFALIPIGGRTLILGSRPVEAVVLAVTAGIALTSGVASKAANRVLFSIIGVALVAVLHSVVFPRHLEFGTADDYVVAAAGFVLTCASTFVFAGWFFERRLFVDTFRRLATAALVVGLAGYAAWRLVGFPDLVSRRIDTGVGRMQGTLSEPSAWAPVLGGLILLALRERRWRTLVVLGVGVALAKSPTVVLVVAASLVIYALADTSAWRARPLRIAGVVAAVVAGLWFVETADPVAWSNSDNEVSQSIGKLLSGIDNVRTGGDVGRNDRYQSTDLTFDEIDELDIGLVGAGPDAHAVYFAEKYPAPAGALRGPGPNAIWVMAAFNFGWLGMLALLALLALTVARMRRDMEVAAVLLPFVLASLVNSASGFALYKFTLLAMLLFVFGWSRLRADDNAADRQPTRRVDGEGSPRPARVDDVPAVTGPH
jgi:hypothetical protein